NQVVDLGGGQSSQHGALLVHDPGNVGQQHQLLGFQHLGDLAGNRVRVDVVRGSVAVGANRGNHRNEVTVGEGLQHLGIDALDCAYLSHVQHLAVDGAL